MWVNSSFWHTDDCIANSKYQFSYSVYSVFTCRNSHIMQSCLKIFNNVLGKLTTKQILTWLPLICKCQSIGNAACRQLSHAIFMNIYSTYKDKTIADVKDVTQELVSSSQEQLLLALSDDSQANRFNCYTPFVILVNFCLISHFRSFAYEINLTKFFNFRYLFLQVCFI